MWKDYTKEENTLESTLAVLHFYKLISIFYGDYLERSIAISPPIDSAPTMVKPIVKLRAKVSSIKQKRGQSAKTNDTSKYAKKS